MYHKALLKNIKNLYFDFLGHVKEEAVFGLPSATNHSGLQVLIDTCRDFVKVGSFIRGMDKKELQEVLTHYPDVLAAFAYGSGVVEQGGYDYSGVNPAQLPMVDMIFVVEDAVRWHAENLVRNRDHYSSFIASWPLGSPGVIAYVQTQLGARVWFNAYIPMKTNRMLKYGVIERSALLSDLFNWDTLYIAGRLHKPVLLVKSTPEIDEAIEVNRRHAVRAALLLMPKIFTELDLYLGVASLSYIGDPRMIFGENPKKVANLVTPIVPQYRKEYHKTLQNILNDPISLPIAGTREMFHPPGSEPALKVVSQSQYHQDQDVIYRQEGSWQARWSLCLGLPKAMKRVLLIDSRARASRFLSMRPPRRAVIRTALVSIVARSASTQSLKGMLTVGLLKSAKYMLAKVSKRFTGK